MRKFKTNIDSVLLFGGTFDPPHKGHIEALEVVINNICPSETYVIPAVLAGSVDGKKGPVTSFEQRIKMIQISLDESGLSTNPCIFISKIEKSMPTPNFTFKTIEEIKKRTKKKIIFMMGQDQITSFHRWKNPIDILENCHLVAVKRVDEAGDFINDTINMLNNLNLKASCKKSSDKITDISIESPPSSIILMEYDISEARSSVYRRCRSYDEHWLYDGVKRYIQDNHLYK